MPKMKLRLGPPSFRIIQLKESASSTCYGKGEKKRGRPKKNEPLTIGQNRRRNRDHNGFDEDARNRAIVLASNDIYLDPDACSII